MNRFRKFLSVALCGMFMTAVSSCSEEKLSDTEVIDNFVTYANKGTCNVFVDEENGNTLTIQKIVSAAGADNQVIVMGYSDDASDAFRGALLEEFFGNKDNRLMAALINKNMPLRIVYSGKVVSFTANFSPEDLDSQRRRK